MKSTVKFKATKKLLHQYDQFLSLKYVITPFKKYLSELPFIPMSNSNASNRKVTNGRNRVELYGRKASRPNDFAIFNSTHRKRKQ